MSVFETKHKEKIIFVDKAIKLYSGNNPDRLKDKDDVKHRREEFSKQ